MALARHDCLLIGEAKPLQMRSSGVNGSCLPSFHESAGTVLVGLRPTDFGW
jgi:hypothetical protein